MVEEKDQKGKRQKVPTLYPKHVGGLLVFDSCMSSKYLTPRSFKQTQSKGDENILVLIFIVFSVVLVYLLFVLYFLFVCVPSSDSSG